MAYTKTNWVNGQTPINADNLNKIENGIEKLVSIISSSDAKGSVIIGDIGIEWGTVSATVAAESNTEVNVAFTLPFKYIPHMTPSLDTNTRFPNLFMANCYDVTKTGAIFNFKTVYANSITLSGRWVAIGKVEQSS